MNEEQVDDVASSPVEKERAQFASVWGEMTNWRTRQDFKIAAGALVMDAEAILESNTSDSPGDVAVFSFDLAEACREYLKQYRAIQGEEGEEIGTVFQQMPSGSITMRGARRSEGEALALAEELSQCPGFEEATFFIHSGELK